MVGTTTHEESRILNPSQNHGYTTTMLEAVEEVKRISDISFPITAMSLLNYFKNMASVVSMGRLGSLELAGGALAVGFTNITGYSVLSGLASGMEPICGQAIGSKNLSLASLTLKRTIFLLLLASLPISLLWLNLQPLMLVLRQNPRITNIASLYCRFALPDLVANSALHPIRIYLRSKGTTWPLMWCTLVSVVFHVPITWLFTFYLSLGVAGVAVSSFVTNFVSLFFLLCYMYTCANEMDSDYDDKPTRTATTTSSCLKTPLMLMSLSGSTTRDREIWSSLVGLAVPSCVAVCLEWWWYEFMTILAGYLPEPETALAAAAIVIQTTSLMYTVPTALSAAASTRVSNEREGAVSVVGRVGTTAGREAWGRVFTSDRAVVELAAAVLPVVGVCEMANCPQTTSCGILRGSARPRVGAKINFYAFYVVGAPLAVGLGFGWRLGFIGLCYGLLGAQIVCAMSILTVVYYTDWERESLKARDFVGRSGISLDDDSGLVKCEEGRG
ncbi:PREDICTED: LOW QUALITY PROTEIN: protein DETOXIFICATION 55 [Tarenaya hassleriana]|uniref:LOW QUALITY PROTEIN: protein DETOXIFICATION 55 n=1 Tax=Tarenaya hassleriana TaxID=28532 RepID=UPI00053C1DE9|nr:PREDICTED: LOW QUALITY PROTEIN: protein DETOXIFICATION 55 [Tarenaya hassleriana]